MDSYRRPRIEPAEFRDDDGRVINFGNRWGMSSPPEDSYSSDLHSARFAPLHVIARALIEHLAKNFAVTVTGDVDASEVSKRLPSAVVEAVRVEPTDKRCAALTFVLTGYPGLIVQAGLDHEFAFPMCGCEACDGTWDREADELESLVYAVASGSYRASVASSALLPVSDSVTGVGGALEPGDVASDRWAAWPTWETRNSE